MSWSADSRLAERIRQRVANCVLFELQDPRISFITITRVRLAKDLSVCTVFYSVFGTAAERSKTEHALRDARGFVQRVVAKVLHTRTTPHLDFEYDHSIEGGLRMGQLLDQLKEERGESDEDTGDPATGSPDASAAESALGVSGLLADEAEDDDEDDEAEDDADEADADEIDDEDG